MCMMCKRLSFVYSYLFPAPGVEDKDRERGPALIIASCCFGPDQRSASHPDAEDGSKHPFWRKHLTDTVPV